MSEQSLSGTLKKKGEIQTYASGFTKREIVILTQEQYPQPINIELLSDKVDLVDYVKEGDEIKVHINIRGREWTSPQGEVKYFNSIVGWKIENLSATQPTESAKPADHQPSSAKDVFTEDEDDDLPF